MPESAPPTPEGARTVDEVVRRLRELRTWAGVSEREVHRRVRLARRERGVPEVPVFDTVRRCFTAGRKRLDIDLVVDIAAVLGADASAWRRVLQSIAGWAGEPVATFDRLPADLAEFSGRDGELRLLHQLAAADRAVISVEGMPGVGKTTLVNRFAHLVAARHAGRVLWADLRGNDAELPPANPAAVLDGFARHLGGKDYHRCLRGGGAVVVLDNAAAEEQVAPLLSDNTLVLITSRRSLRALPGAHHVALDVFTPREAVEFLGRAVGTDRVDAEPAAAAEIASTTGFLPLTLGLVASRISATTGWTLGDHLARLRARGMRLDARIELEFTRSYRALSEARQRMFRLLALHPGRDFDGHAAAALTGAELNSSWADLDALVVRNLLQQHVSGRYRYHDLLRTYALNQVIEHDSVRSQQEARARLVAYYWSAAAAAMDQYAPYEQHRGPMASPLTFDNRQDATRWLDAERANLVAVAGLDESCGAALSELLTQYLEGGTHYRDAELLHTLATRSPDPRQRAHALRRVSVMRWKTGHYHAALEQLRHALTLFRTCGDEAGTGKTLNNLGTVCRRLGRYAAGAV